jgi:hypothetical protein
MVAAPPRHADLPQHAGGLRPGQVAQRVDAEPDVGGGVVGDQIGELGVGVAQVGGVQPPGTDDRLAPQRLP